MQPPDDGGRRGHRPEAATHQSNTFRVNPAVSSAPTTDVFIVGSKLADGTIRRRVFMTLAGALRAVDREREAGRPATYMRATMTPRAKS